MSWTGSLASSLLVALTRPAWWALSLAGFLARGGWLLILLPIITLPTTAGIANAVAPTLVGFLFGGPSGTFLGLVASIVVLLVAWFVVGGLVGAWIDLELVRGASVDDELEGTRPATRGDPARAFIARALAHVPTALVLIASAYPVIVTTYDELIRPGDPSLVVPLRVALRIPVVVAALLIAWLFGETAGGLAERHLAWGAGLGRALLLALRSLATPAALGTLLISTAVLAVVAIGSLGAVAVAWDHLRIVLADGRASDVRLGLVVFSLTWVAALWLLSIVATWRATAWTFEIARRAGVGTIESHAT